MFSVKNIMTTDIISVHVETPVIEALHLLSEKQVSGLPVIDSNNDVVGILSEKDVLQILIDKSLNGKKLVGDYMSRDVVSFTEDDNAIEICKFFVKSHIRRVPIVREGKLVGIVSRRDIVKLILEARSTIDDLRLS